jgi:hypothetical protein
MFAAQFLFAHNTIEFRLDEPIQLPLVAAMLQVGHSSWNDTDSDPAVLEVIESCQPQGNTSLRFTLEASQQPVFVQYMLDRATVTVSLVVAGLASEAIPLTMNGLIDRVSCAFQQ